MVMGAGEGPTLDEVPYVSSVVGSAGCRRKRKAAVQEIVFTNIGNQHASGIVSDGYWRFRLSECQLGGDAACPEDWHFTFVDRNRIAEVGLAQVRYTDLLRGPEMHGRAMNLRQATCDLYGANGISRLQRPHGHDKISGERSSRFTCKARAVHGNVSTEFDMTHRDAMLQQCSFERKRAPNQEGYKVILPQMEDVLHDPDLVTIPKYAVTWQVRPDVDLGAHSGQRWIARLADREKRARFWIRQTEVKKVRRPISWKHDQVPLHVPIGPAGRLPGNSASPNLCTDRGRRKFQF